MSARLCCSYLRVYQPIDALSESEQALVRSVRAGATVAGGSELGLLAADECLELYTKRVDGQTLVCPSHTHLRNLLGLVAFERTLPDHVAELFFAKSEVSRARAELETIRQAQPGIRPSVVQAVWHVPVRWFVCFDDSERRIEDRGDHLAIRYETMISTARERVASALDSLSGGIVHPVIVGMVYELKEWLATFHPDSLLELDYATVATLFDPDELADDHSSSDVWTAIEALADGDGMKAGLFYRRVNERWSAPRRFESLN
jgi:hypothetical protein